MSECFDILSIFPKRRTKTINIREERHPDRFIFIYYEINNDNEAMLADLTWVFQSDSIQLGSCGLPNGSSNEDIYELQRLRLSYKMEMNGSDKYEMIDR